MQKTTTEHKVLRALLKNDGRTYERIGKDAGGIGRARVAQIAKKHKLTRRGPLGVLQVKCVHCKHLTPAVPVIS